MDEIVCPKPNRVGGGLYWFSMGVDCDLEHLEAIPTSIRMDPLRRRPRTMQSDTSQTRQIGLEYTPGQASLWTKLNESPAFFSHKNARCGFPGTQDTINDPLA